jgi:uncharacterized membrane protein
MALADLLRLLPLMLALLASALMAGFVYAYSFSVMPGLAAGDPLSAVRAMRSINAVVRTPVFAFAFFGALAFPLLAAVVALPAGRHDVAALALAAALAYGLGVVAVTFAANIPLNESLAAAGAAAVTAEDAPALWQGYARPWTAWNHLRTLASILSLACAAAALVRAFR